MWMMGEAGGSWVFEKIENPIYTTLETRFD